jgi:uncharacterized protein YukE
LPAAGRSNPVSGVFVSFEQGPARLRGGTGGFTAGPTPNNIDMDNSRVAPGVRRRSRGAARPTPPNLPDLAPGADRTDSERRHDGNEARSQMAQAVVNPEELRRFASQLKRFNNEMITQLTTLHGQLAGLSQTWRDREHDKFAEEFEQTLTVVKRFVDATNQHIPFLLRKAERIEDYLQQR